MMLPTSSLPYTVSTTHLTNTSRRSPYRLQGDKGHGSDSTIHKYTNPDTIATVAFEARGAGWQGECVHGGVAGNTRGSREFDRVHRAGDSYRTRPLIQQKRKGLEPAPEHVESLGPWNTPLRSPRPRSGLRRERHCFPETKPTRSGIVTRPSAKASRRSTARAHGRAENKAEQAGRTEERSEERAKARLGTDRYAARRDYRGGDPGRLAPAAAQGCHAAPRTGIGPVRSLRGMLT